MPGIEHIIGVYTIFVFSAAIAASFNEHLKELQLAKRFGCTRGPVREALNQLEQQGFVNLVPNQGATVKGPSPREVEDFYNLMAVLEGRAVKWATPLLTDENIRRLKAVNKSLKTVAEKKEKAAEDWIPLNIEFHRIFKENCGNAKMHWLVEEIRTRITRYRYISLMVTAFADYAADHDKIISLVEQRETQKAGKAMEEHIHRSKNVLVSFLSRRPAGNMHETNLKE
ncbi:MAG: GntR family transcriptional regulator [Desulfobacteraceae bacterium]|nr:GntR family transcriptional regulator [Desulfobacteraceae bacterium]